MTLHEAIEKLLHSKGQPMTTQQIANELNINNWYKKKDGSQITAFQIHGRTKNYASIFNRNGSLVSLIGQKRDKTDTLKTEKTNQKLNITDSYLIDISSIEKILMNEDNFKNANSIDNRVSHKPGLYCIRIIDINKLPFPFNNYLLERQHNILYIGLATESLNKRFLNQELRAKGHGSFFRSIGAILGYRPQKGSLVNKANKINYTFSTNDEQKIIKWINDNLKVNWVDYIGNLDIIETELITQYLPLINLAKNPQALPLLSKIRKECVQIANEL